MGLLDRLFGLPTPIKDRLQNEYGLTVPQAVITRVTEHCLQVAKSATAAEKMLGRNASLRKNIDAQFEYAARMIAITSRGEISAETFKSRSPALFEAVAIGISEGRDTPKT